MGLPGLLSKYNSGQYWNFFATLTFFFLHIINARDRKHNKYFSVEDGCDLSHLIYIVFLEKKKETKLQCCLLLS